MAKRMMLLPPELYDGYQRRYQQQLAPEIRLQDDIESLLDREQLPDDAKAKILGHLITRFQKVSHAPPERIRVRISDDKPEERESRPEHGSVNVTEFDPVVRDILKSVPQTHSKFVPMILEKLKTTLFLERASGEIAKDGDVRRSDKYRGGCLPPKSEINRNLDRPNSRGARSLIRNGLRHRKGEGVDKILRKIYYNVEHPASYGGVEKLSKASGVSLKKTREWLMGEDTYTLHKPARRNFPRRKVLSYGIGELMQCDLLDVSKYASQNKNIRYLLTAIDVFSKKGYAIPVKRKNADALVEVFKKAKNIINLQTDEGGEFYSGKVKALLKQRRIHHYRSYSAHKSSVVERYNRTIRGRLHRLFTHRGSYKYIDVLEKILNAYNNSYHRSIGLSPNQVTPELEPTIFKRLYNFHPVTKYPFELNDQKSQHSLRRCSSRGHAQVLCLVMINHVNNGMVWQCQHQYRASPNKKRRSRYLSRR
ncbi:hypothetical protein JTE90_008639 [Oedothorax gibbosus]|uniref:Integrase catalytic domain-containing protein n=1 Tax=Oedothorax gibbosus TaxID=931172 RepID=A0AAV6U1N7_9ARAC|nr:hypothetical protein JTE90_008639 [Oedothorax gibbosus]